VNAALGAAQQLAVSETGALAGLRDLIPGMPK